MTTDVNGTVYPESGGTITLNRLSCGILYPKAHSFPGRFTTPDTRESPVPVVS